IGDRDDDRGVSSAVGAHRARILRIDIAAYAAHLDFFEGRLYGGGERRHHLIALFDEKERRASRRARSEAGQAREETDQALGLGASSGGGHGRGMATRVRSYCTAVDGSGARSAVIN